MIDIKSGEEESFFSFPSPFHFLFSVSSVAHVGLELGPPALASQLPASSGMMLSLIRDESYKRSYSEIYKTLDMVYSWFRALSVAKMKFSSK